MGNNSSKNSLFTASLFVLLIGIAAWSFWYRGISYRRLENDQANLTACHEAAAKISKLRQQKQRALLQSKPSEELNRKVEEWAGTTGLDLKAVARIEPREPRRVGDTQYLEQVTELELSGVTLEKTLRFSQLAESSEEGLKLTSMRLSLPHLKTDTPPESECWNAELSLTYLIYSPKNTARK